MRYSQLFGKTNKKAKSFDSVNATLLIKAGYIDQLMAGVYTMLPLGLRVMNKIETVVREEMSKISNEVLMPSLSPRELWQKTGRLDTVDVIMQTIGANQASLAKNDSSYILNSTHEEIVTPLASKFTFSYKQLPLSLFQIQNKFRNEPRAKSGLMRCREFRMKDMYSFHVSMDDMKTYYEVAKQAYVNVFKRLGIGDDTIIAWASGGDFTKEYSHEFQTVCNAGEDLIFRSLSNNINYNREIAPAKAPHFNQEGEVVAEKEDVFGEGLIGVDPLAKLLNIPVEKTTKTLFYETDNKELIAVAVRGDYEVNELKLKNALDRYDLKLATKELITEKTGAEVGYAGVINLPKEIPVYFDDSCQGRINFETGANKTNYHVINVNFGRDLPEPDKFYDFKLAKEGDLNPETNEVYEVVKASEVGNIFTLGSKFTDAFDFKYIDESGKQQTIYMGCYGIGTSRIMGVIVEKFHDDNGIIWPQEVAPFQIHLVGLNLEDENVKLKAEEMYQKLLDKGVEVLFDDRVGVSVGEKLGDADLIGIPKRIIISKKSLEASDTYEVKLRNADSSQWLRIEEVF